jgi:hypothetical protein
LLSACSNLTTLNLAMECNYLVVTFLVFVLAE